MHMPIIHIIQILRIFGSRYIQFMWFSKKSDMRMQKTSECPTLMQIDEKLNTFLSRCGGPLGKLEPFGLEDLPLVVQLALLLLQLLLLHLKLPLQLGLLLLQLPDKFFFLWLFVENVGLYVIITLCLNPIGFLPVFILYRFPKILVPVLLSSLIDSLNIET